MATRIWTDEEMRGKTVNSLTLVSSYKGEQNKWWWECLCECGKTVQRREDFIRSGKAKSCGCKHPRRARGEGHLSWKGVGELNGQYFSQLRSSAGVRGIHFYLDIEYLWELFRSQGGKCALTGLPLVFQTLKDKMAGVEQTASLDRKDSDLGYVEGNVWWVHKDVNRIKQGFSLDRFLEVCRQVAANFPEAR